MKSKLILIIAIFLTISDVNAQEVLSLENAVAYALENNNLVKIAKENTVIAENSVTSGNAGMLPTLTASANTNLGVNNATLQFANTPAQTDIPAAQSSSYGTSLQASYTLFGGLGARYNLKKLKQNRDVATIQERIRIESVALQTAQLYYQILQAQFNVKILKEALKISSERLQRAKIRNQVSGGTKLDVLNAEVDYNSDSLNLMNAENVLDNAKLNFKKITKYEDDFKTDSIFNLKLDYSISEFQEKAKENNTDLINAEYNLLLSETNSKISRAALMPRLTWGGSYNFSHSENEASVLLFSENSGFSTNLQLSIPIWDGHKKSIQYQNAKAQIKIAELNKQELATNLQKDIEIAYLKYQNAINISNLDVTNLKTAKLNFERSKEMFNLGQITSTDFRTAQLNWLKTQNQASINKINIKLAEIELLRLSGQLLN